MAYLFFLKINLFWKSICEIKNKLYQLNIYNYLSTFFTFVDNWLYILLLLFTVGVLIYEVLQKKADIKPTHPNVNSEVFQVPLASQGRHQGTWLHPHRHWGWNCTRCNLQTSSPPPRKLCSGEHVCKVHRVQFQPQCLWGWSQVPRCRPCKERGTWQTSELTLGWVGWWSLLFWSTSYMSTPTVKSRSIICSQLSTQVKSE